MSSDDHNQSSQMDLFSLTSDLDIFRHLLADLHNDLPDRVSRLRYLIDLGADLGSQGTMLFGGYAALSAWSEARSSFVNGNYVATILLCQSLIENLLAAFLHTGLMLDDLPPRVKFRETLNACHVKGVVTAKEVQDLDVLMTLRNPLIHFRNINDKDGQISTAAQLIPAITQIKYFARMLAMRSGLFSECLQSASFGSIETEMAISRSAPFHCV